MIDKWPYKLHTNKNNVINKLTDQVDVDNISEMLVESIDLTVREYINENESFYDERKIKIYPLKTAIILIDVWNRNFLSQLVLEKLNSLLKLLRKFGFVIIHAPSQGYQDVHPDLEIDNNDTFITGFDDNCNELQSKGIDTLLYAGFDTLNCVLDKPLGTINNYDIDSSKYRSVMIRDAVFSSHAETQLLGIHIHDGFGLTTTTQDIFSSFGFDYKKCNDEIYPDYNNKESYYKKKIYAKGLLVILFQDSTKGKNKLRINKLDEWAYRNLIPRINFSISSCEIKCSTGELIKTEKDFIKYLRQKNITNIIYAGDSLDGEILYSKIGTIRLYIQNRYKSNPMPNCFVVGDCSTFSRRPIKADEEVLKNVLLNTNRWFVSISFDNLRKALTHKDINCLAKSRLLFERLNNKILRIFSKD